MRMYLGAGVLFALATAAIPVSAATITFSGSRTNVDAPGPAAARCGARATTNVVHNPPTATSVGLSNLGAFTPTLSHCIQLPLSNVASNPFDLGQFTFDFGAGNALIGTYSGFLDFISPGMYTVNQTHLVTGGTGIFFNANGTFASSGTLSFLTGRPTVAQTFSGTLNLIAVPEPSTWVMLISGFGLLGGAMRRRKPAPRTWRQAVS